MTKREWLITKGLAKEGRGRMSREAHSALAQAESDGMIFDLPVAAAAAPRSPAAPSKASAPRATQRKTPAAAPQAGQTVVTETPQHRHAERYRGEGTRVLSVRDCCAACGYSIGWCPCAVPSGWTDDTQSRVPVFPYSK